MLAFILLSHLYKESKGHKTQAMKHALQVIQPIAIEIWEAIKPFCEKVKIAGSIRRQAQYCKDIEIVLLPKDRASRNKIGLFFLQNGKVVKGGFKGRYAKCSYRGFKVDVFIPQRHDYFRQLAIRTGSAEYSKRIAQKWSQLGYIGTKEGLKHKSLTIEDDIISWESERHFFKFLEMDYLQPKDRI